MKPLTGRQLSDTIDPAGDNTDILAQAYDLALETAASLFGSEQLQEQIKALKIDRSDMSSEDDEV